MMCEMYRPLIYIGKCAWSLTAGVCFVCTSCMRVVAFIHIYIESRSVYRRCQGQRARAQKLSPLSSSDTVVLLPAFELVGRARPPSINLDQIDHTHPTTTTAREKTNHKSHTKHTLLNAYCTLHSIRTNRVSYRLARATARRSRVLPAHPKLAADGWHLMWFWLLLLGGVCMNHLRRVVAICALSKFCRPYIIYSESQSSRTRAV